MLRVFSATDTDFSSNGDVVLKPIRAVLRKEDNGDYYIDLECGAEYADFLLNNKLIVADTPQGVQPFRITNPVKTGRKVTCRAWHIFYDTQGYVIADSNVVRKNCADALSQLNNASDPNSPFTTSSDITTISSYRCVRESLYAAIFVLLERYGGHLVRDGNTISINQHIGQDNQQTVTYHNNLKDITYEEDWAEVCTRVLPVGKDGTLLNAVDPYAPIFLDSFVQYDIPYCKTVTFDQQDIIQEDYDTETEYKEALVADLTAQANAWLTTVAEPKRNYTLSANLDKVTDVGDPVLVKDKRLGINIDTNIIAFEYDLIAKRYTLIEFGNFRPKLRKLIGVISKNVEDMMKGISMRNLL